MSKRELDIEDKIGITVIDRQDKTDTEAKRRKLNGRTTDTGRDMKRENEEEKEREQSTTVNK